MIEGWENMSWSQKQEAFLTKWASGEGIPFVSDEANAAYRYRAGLIKDAVTLKKTPERVPIVPVAVFAPISLYACSPKQAMYDPHVLGKVCLDYTRDYDPDATVIPPMVMHGPVLEVLDYTLYKWPGRGIRDEQGYQFVEKEYMKAEDYDHFIADPTDYWLRVWLPRTHGALKGFAQMPPLYASVELAMVAPWLCALGAPPVQESLKALTEAGRISFEWIQALGPYMGQMLASGYPMLAGAATKAPFDTLGDSFRGTTGLMMDMYRRPDKVLQAVERLVPLMISMGVGGAVANNNPIVFIPLHKGADGFMSNEQFKKFYWPTLKKVIVGLAENGCMPCCFVEGAYNQRLEFLTELPDGMCAFIFDRTDMGRAREVLGGKSCIGGGFPVSLIITGSAGEVEEETKKLLDVAAGDGGYVLSIGCAMDEAREHTLKAFIQAGKKYGRY
ncbi:MAG TPA: uroporphyrinogen decarboxylase family protein [Syntrophobacteraceae bacterium]|nr:uroporphyrinogen decarboxylase family protein [Syntrophobacteraceae bacterium]